MPKMTKNIELHIHVELYNRLDRLAASTECSKSFYLIRTLEEHLSETEYLYGLERDAEALRHGELKTQPLDDLCDDLGIEAPPIVMTKRTLPEWAHLVGGVAALENPRGRGKSLMAKTQARELSDWRYRMNCDIRDYRLVIVAPNRGYPHEVYDDHDAIHFRDFPSNLFRQSRNRPTDSGPLPPCRWSVMKVEGL